MRHSSNVPIFRRPFDAPAVDSIDAQFDTPVETIEDVEEVPAVDGPIEFVSETRKRRQVVLLDSAAGTMDVRVDMNTLDIEENVRYVQRIDGQPHRSHWQSGLLV